MGEFMGRKLAHQHAASAAKPRRCGGVFVGDMVLGSAGMTGCQYARTVVNVLQAKRDAMQRPKIATGGYLRLSVAGGGQRLFASQCNEGVQLRVDGVNSRQQRFNQVYR